MNPSYTVIFNPVAGKGAALNRLPLIENFFTAHKLTYSLLLTEAPGHAIELARQVAGETDTVVVAAGGDGTCNEVLNGLMRGKGEAVPLFGVLPLGRGNDFAYGGKVPASLTEALEILEGGSAAPLDVGLITGGDYPGGRYFGNGIGVGFDTVVGLEAARMTHLHDAVAYLLGTLKTLVKFSGSPEVEIRYNNQTTTLTAIQISIMNGQRMGGLFYMAPEAHSDDGLFDLCMVTHQTRLKLVRAVIHYLRGTQKGLPGITMDRAESFTIEALSGGLTVHADGETICTNGRRVEVTCIPGPLRIIRREAHAAPPLPA